MTRRQFAAWEEWTAAQWNEHDRHDWQTAAVVAEIRRLFSKDPSSIKVDDCLVKFERRLVTKEQEVELPPGFPRRVRAGDKDKVQAALAKAKASGKLTKSNLRR